MITFDDFSKVDIRVGKITNAELLKDGKYSTHRVAVDFGDTVGTKQSCARLVNYSIDDLVGKQVVAVVNFSPKQIGKHISEVLLLGVPDNAGECVLLAPDSEVPLGGNVY